MRHGAAAVPVVAIIDAGGDCETNFKSIPSEHKGAVHAA
jgi:hypothetical protein